MVIVCILIGIGTVAVVRGQDSEEFLATAREPDLIRLLDDLQSRQTRLDGEILRLQAAEQNLRTGTTAEALQQAQERADDLRVLAGTTLSAAPGSDCVSKVRTPSSPLICSTPCRNFVMQGRGH